MKALVTLVLATVFVYTIPFVVSAEPGMCLPGPEYKGIKQDVNVDIPDNDPAGILIGPIVFPPDSLTILDIIVDLQISHTWGGDLIVELRHIHGTVTKAALLMNRQGGNTDLDPSDKYYFAQDPTLKPIGGQGSPAPHGCYSAALGFTLDEFKGQPKDGEWFLFVSDNAGLDFGTVFNWSLHFLNPPVSVDAASWGSVKAAYRQ